MWFWTVRMGHTATAAEAATAGASTVMQIINGCIANNYQCICKCRSKVKSRDHSDYWTETRQMRFMEFRALSHQFMSNWKRLMSHRGKIKSHFYYGSYPLDRNNSSRTLEIHLQSFILRKKSNGILEINSTVIRISRPKEPRQRQKHSSPASNCSGQFFFSDPKSNNPDIEIFSSRR